MHSQFLGQALLNTFESRHGRHLMSSYSHETHSVGSQLHQDCMLVSCLCCGGTAPPALCHALPGARSTLPLQLITFPGRLHTCELFVEGKHPHAFAVFRPGLSLIHI